MSPSVRDYLRHILDEANYLTTRSQGLGKEKFIHDDTLKRAFVRSLEIIGEAAKQIPDPVRQRSPQIERRAVAGMRDRLIHSYLGVDCDIVWDVVVTKIPTLTRQIQKLLDEEQPWPSELKGQDEREND